MNETIQPENRLNGKSENRLTIRSENPQVKVGKPTPNHNKNNNKQEIRKGRKDFSRNHQVGIFREDFLRWMVYNVRVRNWNRNRSARMPPGGESPPTISAASGRSQFRTGIFSKSLLSRQCPVSLLRCSRCIDQSPPCERGVPRQRRGGGIPQSGSFPHGFVLSRSANCKSLSQKSKIFASSHRPGAFGADLWLLRFRPRNIKYAQIPLTYNRFYCMFDLETP